MASQALVLGCVCVLLLLVVFVFLLFVLFLFFTLQALFLVDTGLEGSISPAFCVKQLHTHLPRACLSPAPTQTFFLAQLSQGSTAKFSCLYAWPLPIKSANKCLCSAAYSLLDKNSGRDTDTHGQTGWQVGRCCQAS